MNIEATGVKNTSKNTQTKLNNQQGSEALVKFSDELKEIDNGKKEVNETINEDEKQPANVQEESAVNEDADLIKKPDENKENDIRRYDAKLEEDLKIKDYNNKKSSVESLPIDLNTLVNNENVVSNEKQNNKNILPENKNQFDKNINLDEKSELKLQSEFQPQVKSEIQVEPKASLELNLQLESEKQVKSEIQVEPKVPLELNLQLEPEKQAKPEIQVEPKAPLELNIQPEPEKQVKSEVQVEPKAPLELNIQPEPEKQVKSEVQVEPKAPLELNVQNELKQKVEYKTKVERKSKPLNIFEKTYKQEVPEKKEADIIDENKINNTKVVGALIDLNNIVQELNQLEEKEVETIKKESYEADSNNMINNDFNIENKDLLPQMNSNMSFNTGGQPFSSFMNEEEQKKTNKSLNSSAAELAEEAAILSTMAENIAIANKNTIIKPEEKTVINNEGIKKVDVKTGITVENIVKFDSVIMNEADVEVFTQLVQNGQVDVNNLAPQAAEKSVQVSKTLADMIAKSMETGQPLRIDFDNDISVIIRISRDGKITADFLPSSQVAETYLKENLPLLRQKFDNENVKYDELNQKERREHHREQNRKKGRNDE